MLEKQAGRMMNRLELERQKSSEVQDHSQHILQLTRSRSDSSLETLHSHEKNDSTTFTTESKNARGMKILLCKDIESDLNQEPLKSGQATSKDNDILSNNQDSFAFRSPSPLRLHDNETNGNEESLENTGDNETTSECTVDDQEASTRGNFFHTLSPRTSNRGKTVALCKYRLLSFLLFVATALSGFSHLYTSKLRTASRNDPAATFANASSPLNRPAPSNDPLMTLLWEHTTMLDDETAVGLWQPPLDSILLQGLSPQYQAYLCLDRRYGTELPATQVLLQEYALATLFYATNGPEWTENSHWFDVNNSVCSWFTTEPSCNQQGRLVSLNLNDNGLMGSIPPELGLLQDVQFIRFSKNHLTGSLPSSLSKLVHLKHFDVSFNLLTSTLPTSYGSWVDLKELRIAHNKFSGTFPSDFYSSWALLQRLHMEFNNVQGSIGTEFCDLAYAQCQSLGQEFEFWSDCDAAGDASAVVDCKCCTCCPMERGLCAPNGKQIGWHGM
jgi:hypothetical protein